MQYLASYYSSFLDYSLAHGVNPYIFLAIYVASIPFYYYPFFSLAKRLGFLRAKNNLARTPLKSNLIQYIIINRLAWASPYFYVLIWGKGLPRVVSILIYVYLLLGIIFYFYKYGSKKRQ